MEDISKHVVVKPVSFELDLSIIYRVAETTHQRTQHEYHVWSNTAALDRSGSMGSFSCSCRDTDEMIKESSWVCVLSHRIRKKWGLKRQSVTNGCSSTDIPLRPAMQPRCTPRDLAHNGATMHLSRHGGMSSSMTQGIPHLSRKGRTSHLRTTMAANLLW